MRIQTTVEEIDNFNKDQSKGFKYYDTLRCCNNQPGTLVAEDVFGSGDILPFGVVLAKILVPVNADTTTTSSNSPLFDTGEYLLITKAEDIGTSTQKSIVTYYLLVKHEDTHIPSMEVSRNSYAEILVDAAEYMAARSDGRTPYYMASVFASKIITRK